MVHTVGKTQLPGGAVKRVGAFGVHANRKADRAERVVGPGKVEDDQTAVRPQHRYLAFMAVVSLDAARLDHACVQIQVEEGALQGREHAAITVIQGIGSPEEPVGKPLAAPGIQLRMHRQRILDLGLPAEPDADVGLVPIREIAGGAVGFQRVERAAQGVDDAVQIGIRRTGVGCRRKGKRRFLERPFQHPEAVCHGPPLLAHRGIVLVRNRCDVRACEDNVGGGRDPAVALDIPVRHQTGDFRLPLPRMPD